MTLDKQEGAASRSNPGERVAPRQVRHRCIRLKMLAITQPPAGRARGRIVAAMLANNFW
jgi:hypothetical protein